MTKCYLAEEPRSVNEERNVIILCMISNRKKDDSVTYKILKK